MKKCMWVWAFCCKRRLHAIMKEKRKPNITIVLRVKSYGPGIQSCCSEGSLYLSCDFPKILSSTSGYYISCHCFFSIESCMYCYYHIQKGHLCPYMPSLVFFKISFFLFFNLLFVCF